MKNYLGTCRFCGELKKLIKAHIIPECFQKTLKDDNNSMLVLRTSNNSVQHTNSFLFDPNILCSECDNLFSGYENFTARFLDLIRNGKIQPKYVENMGHGIDSIYEVDTFKIKNCLLSILWRMSISKRVEFKSVSLGPLEAEIKSRLNSEHIMDSKFFPITIVSLKKIKDVRSRILSADSPQLKFNGSRMYALHLPQFLIFYHASGKVQFDPKNLSFREDGLISIGEETGGATQQYLDVYYKRVSLK